MTVRRGEIGAETSGSQVAMDATRITVQETDSNKGTEALYYMSTIDVYGGLRACIYHKNHGEV